MEAGAIDRLFYFYKSLFHFHSSIKHGSTIELQYG